MHPPALAGEALDPRVHRPGALLELQLTVFDLERFRARLLALELGEELARVVLGADQPERAGGEQREEAQGETGHRGGRAAVTPASRRRASPRCARGGWPSLRQRPDGAVGPRVSDAVVAFPWLSPASARAAAAAPRRGENASRCGPRASGR